MSVDGGFSPAEHHLGDRLAALIDGELGHDSRDRVLAHLATCRRCKAEADALRQLKSALAVAVPPPSDGLLARLQGLPGMDEAALSRTPLDGGDAGFRVHEIARPGGGHRGRRLAFAAFGGVAFAAFALGGAVSGAPEAPPGGAAPGPTVRPASPATPASVRLNSTGVYSYSAPLQPNGVLAPAPGISEPVISRRVPPR
ncbi:anti-sigma factor family protein [Streptomyces polyrhachis]|uniref:Anti-sigma factor family protein n=1 Tax=Streptomyces polyrhachis TaxID=1282885 RepID=A0ABW2GGJ0_9ACTN